MEELSALEILIRLAAAALLCGAIGYERETRHKPAGLRTNVLVGLGTAAMTIVSIEVARFSPAPEAIDISRIASTILTGIGFIGAGTIIQSRGSVQGLTTAASIWVVAAIGLASGLGLYTLAVITTVAALIALISLRGVKVAEEEEVKRHEKNTHGL
jgi:putative Mg2+ transporter-C (MgtC) family protein